jgi:2-keto-4-pentenoate hydratase/2-oxohepta-3-ene-1,7-dioic acid hydratase in catechol pathway
MKIVRYQEGTAVKWGVLEEQIVREMDGDPFGRIRLTSETKRESEVRLLAPCLPTKVVAIGLNYRDHAEE